MSLYIGVYVALFAYEAQTDEELSVQPDDLLYLLERSDVDDWWKAKKRVLPVGDEEVDEPIGLVPSNYIEPAPAVSTCVALYDYEKQTEEELSFLEGGKFSVYDLNDPDWLLVGDGTVYGFIPSNYVQIELSTNAPSNGASGPASGAGPIAFAPPPQHISRREQPQELDLSDDEPPLPSRPAEPESPTELYPPQPPREDSPPPRMPSRPRGDSQVSDRGRNDPEDLESDTQEHTFDGEFFKWYIDEIDGRKKRAVMLAIGKGLIILKKPELGSPKKFRLRSSSTLDNEWRIKDLLNFSSEKKHLFLELKNPSASIELHCGSKDVTEAITSILADLKGAESARGLKEVERATRPSNSKKIGKLIYDFQAQGNDELGCKEGDEVYIVNQLKSSDWWMCESIDTGRQGVVPSSYIEIVGTTALDKLTDAPVRQKSTKLLKRLSRQRDRDERDKIRERDRVEREKTHSKRDSSDKSMPNFHRVRTWIDSSGTFKVEAEFLGCVEGKIHLHKTNGVKIAVGAAKLSIEDLEYVEKITGTSLESYKEEVAKQTAKRKAAQEKKSRKEEAPRKLAVAAINEVAPPQPSRPKTTTSISTSEPEYDWFDFFLTTGVDIGNCQRYTLTFNREQMDQKILEDITPSLLRTLGLREGDIIRVMKYLDLKFGRQKQEENASGGLFTEPTGALKNNSASEISKVDAKALPTPQKVDPPRDPEPHKIEDDAWAIKPAARSNEDLSKPQQPQYTGSLQDLVDVKPITTDKPMPALPKEASASSAPSAPALTPVKTGTLIQPGQQFVQKNQPTGQVAPQATGQLGGQATGGLIPVQRTGGLVPVQRTGGLVPVQRTGGLVPVVTGGFMTAQPTGFVPITAQPTGFVPIQQTGLVGMPTGVIPITTFNQPVLQAGSVTIPQTSFNAPPPNTFGLSLQQTGPLVPTRTGPQGGFQPQSTFGQQITGGAPPTSFSQQITGGAPPTSFSQQITGGAFGQPPATSFGFQQSTFGQQVTGGAPPTSFGQQITGGFQPQSSFGQQITGGAPVNQFGQNTGFNQGNFGQFQPTGQGQFAQQPFSQQPTFGQQTFQPQTSFGQPQQPQQTFGQPQQTFGQQFGQPQASFGQPQTSFGQPQFEGFGLQSQPTGSGFGNGPLQAQATGKRANLLSATPDNPFGF